jgi:Fimbrial assembly protein (PilN)
MIQDNINLFERKPPSGLASPHVRWALFGCGTVVALGVVAFGLQSRDLYRLRQELVRVQARTNRLQHAITEMPSPDAALTDRLASQERDLQALEAVARTLSTGGLAHTAGFVGPMQAFARATTQGVWLTGLVLDNRHGSMVLEGRALDASRIPALLQTLKAEPYFAGTTFSAIEVTPGADSSAIAADRTLKFRIVTPTIDAGAPDHLAQANTALNPTDRNQR